MIFFKSFVRAAWLLSVFGATSPVFGADREPVGYLASARGEVLVDGVSAKSGTKLYANSRVKTGNGKAAVLLAGESVIQMTFDSELEIKSLIKKSGEGNDSEIDLDHGKVRTLVRDRGTPKHFSIRTRSAVMG